MKTKQSEIRKVAKKKCSKCKGQGEYLFIYPRLNSPPGGYIPTKCEKCNGTGYTLTKRLWRNR